MFSFQTFRIKESIQETDEGSDTCSTINKSNFRDLLLDAIKELQTTDKKEQKATLQKLLSSIQNCSRSQENSPRPPRVKVYHFKSPTMNEIQKQDNEEEDKEKLQEEKKSVDLVDVFNEKKRKEEILAKPRRLNVIFKPMREKKEAEDDNKVVPGGRINLNLTKEAMENANKYRKAFTEFRRNNIMYKKTLAARPWDLVARVSDQIILDIIIDISKDFENEDILKRLYLNELLEVVN